MIEMSTDYLKSKYINRLNIQRKEKKIKKEGSGFRGKKGERIYVQKAKEKSILKEKGMDDHRYQMLEFKENKV